MASTATGLYSRLRPMLPELLRFAVVGGIGSVIDLGGSAVLHDDYHLGPLVAKAVAVTLASVVTYLGSKFWTFKHRDSGPGHREVALFIALNVIGLVIAEVVIAFVTYGLGLHGKLEYNAASVIGTGLATLFRFYSYRKWVFTAPAAEVAGAAPLPTVPQVPDYPPWELDSAFADLATAAAPPPLTSTVPVPVAAQITAPLAAAPTSADAAAAAEEQASSWDTPVPAWGEARVSARELTEPLARQQDSSALPNGRVAAAPPHRATLPAAGQEERRHAPTGPIAPPSPARPAGRHRRH